MFERRQQQIALIVCLLCLVPFLSPPLLAQNQASDDKIIQRYKLMLSRKPKEGSTFERLYQFYLEGAALDQMIADYQAEAEARPSDPNLQLILEHIYK